MNKGAIMDNSKQQLQRAFRLGYAYVMGHSRGRSLALDGEPIWISFKPKKDGGKARRVLVDESTYEILGGSVPKSFKGIKLTKKENIKADSPNPFTEALAKTKAQKGKGGKPNQAQTKQNAAANTNENQPAANIQSQELTEAQKALDDKQKELDALKAELEALKKKANPERKLQIDTENPEKIPSDVILQNRDRTNFASSQQLKDIARNLDYYKVGTSNNFNSGCPVVSYGSYSDDSMGKKTVLSTNDGKRLEVQYAVVEASSVACSNNFDGSINEQYNSDDPNFTRAIAGNGRMIGITASYERYPEKAAAYKQDLIDNASDHGCNPELIKGMKNPVLVRVMQPKDVTNDIGDQTNITQGLTLNVVEQSRNDVNRITNLEETSIYDDGAPTVEATLGFIQGLPKSEQAGLLTDDGKPSRIAQDRLQNALIMKGFNSDALIKMRGQAINPSGKNILAGLSASAKAFAQLEGEGDYDIRNSMASLINAFALEKNNSGEWFHYQRDMFLSEEQNQMFSDIAHALAKHKRSAANIGTILKTVASELKEASIKKEQLQSHGSLASFFDMEANIITPAQAIKNALDKAERIFQNKENERKQKQDDAKFYKELARKRKQEELDKHKENSQSSLVWANDSAISLYDRRRAFLHGYAFMYGRIMGTLFGALDFSPVQRANVMEGI